jgi:hypothetical protein
MDDDEEVEERHSLIEHACQAEERIGLDELEEYANASQGRSTPGSPLV